MRKDLIDFVVAFLEEKRTPIRLIQTIKIVFNPNIIFDSVIKTLKKLYIKIFYVEEEQARAEAIEKQQILKKPSEGNLFLREKGITKVEEYERLIFNENIYNQFNKMFFDDTEFCSRIEFEVANRMFQYVKLLATEYDNIDSNRLLDIVNKYSTREINHKYSSFKKIKKNSDDEQANQDVDLSVNDKSFQNYYTIKFFENITRMVKVQSVDEGKIIISSVLFTVNPKVQYLSKNTKTNFVYKVNRDNRYTKLYSLMEYSGYFFEEIKYSYARSN